MRSLWLWASFWAQAVSSLKKKHLFSFWYSCGCFLSFSVAWEGDHSTSSPEGVQLSVVPDLGDIRPLALPGGPTVASFFRCLMFIVRCWKPPWGLVWIEMYVEWVICKLIVDKPYSYFVIEFVKNGVFISRLLDGSNCWCFNQET